MSGKKPGKHLSITCSIRSAGRKKLLVYHIAKRAFLFLKYSLPDMLSSLNNIKIFQKNICAQTDGAPTFV